MILKDLTIRGFGKFHDRKIEFADGMNILYGGNEAGKSTLHAFLRAMFYGMERARGRAARNDFYARYEPWFGDGAYGGIIRLENRGHIYRIERNFARNPKDLTIVDETSGITITDPEPFLKGLLNGLSETAYRNTVSISQLKSATDSEMVNELKNYIANMNTTGNVALNITKASAYLKDQKKSFESRIVPDAAKNYAANLSEIRKIEEQISSPDYANRMNELTQAKASAEQAKTLLNEKRAGILMKNAADRQMLRGRHFENRGQLSEFLNAASEALERWKAAREKASSGGRKLLAIFFGLLTAALFGGALWASGNLQEVYTPLAVPMNAILAAAGALSLIPMMIFLNLDGKRKKEEAAEKAAFEDVIRPYFPELLPSQTGPADCSETFEKVKAETDSLIAVCDRVDQGEQSLAGTEAELKALEARQTETDATIVRQQRSQWELEQQLEHLTNLRDESAALKNVIAENDRLREEIEAIDIAQETMNRLSTTIRDSFGLYLNKSASDLIGGITGGIYTSLSIDQDLNVFLNTEQKLIPLDQVSSGTMDQVYLALRLAAADLMQGGADQSAGPGEISGPEPVSGEKLPLFFDDSFVNYDEHRLRTVLLWLAETFRSRQILIFSCHRREAQLLTANRMEYQLTEL